MNKSNRFSHEVRERAVRMVQEHRNEYPSQWAAIESIAPKIGCVPQTLHDRLSVLAASTKPGAIQTVHGTFTYVTMGRDYLGQPRPELSLLSD